MSKAESMISAKLRQSYENDLQAMAVSILDRTFWSFEKHFTFELKCPVICIYQFLSENVSDFIRVLSVVTASKHDVPWTSSYGHDGHQWYGLRQPRRRVPGRPLLGGLPSCLPAHSSNLARIRRSGT